MNVSDFASVVQLGVGLHAGTALLQIYGEIGLQPTIRSINRIKGLSEDPTNPLAPEYEDRIRIISSDFEIFKIKMAREYRGYFAGNALIAAVLTLALVVMAYTAASEMPLAASIVLVAVSVLPAPITLFCFWVDAERELQPIRGKIAAVEAALLGG